MGFIEKFVRQCRKPRGMFGRFVGRSMNFGHAKIRRWGLGYVSEMSCDAVLDVGCGGGGALREMTSTFPGAILYGIDYSQDMALLAKKIIQRLAQKYQTAVILGSVTALPFSDNTFDLVTAFETYYFWPDLIHDLQEIKRTLKPGGRLLLVNEAYKNDAFKNRNDRWAGILDMALHTPLEYREFLSTAGYEAIAVHERVEKNWIAAVARKTEKELR